ncbi:MAG: methylenetetrahydrofolate reductase [NAD(P)H] [Acetobacter sp.]|jgi:methylenetetrahydrofolate reductase (NADPH)|nr:methylenetetrahydrofolate reductase [NAD(P)H] [Acetobacter sp.]
MTFQTTVDREASRQKPRVSFEFFPAKSEKSMGALLAAAEEIAPVKPAFFSMTYGAGGSTRDRSLEAVEKLVNLGSVPVAGHLTCVDASRETVDEVARSYLRAGVKHIVALRGDSSEVGKPFTPHPDGYRNAADLVAGLKKIADFEISVAAYPEMHPEARSPEADLDNLKAKIDAGATRAITQFFFEAETFLRFRDRAAAVGITVPIVPGILPVASVTQAWKFAEMCGAHVPDHLRTMFDGLDEQPSVRHLVTTAVAGQMCLELQKNGVDDFHFYTLNKATPSLAICRLLGVS